MIIIKKFLAEAKQLAAFRVPNKRGWTHALQDWFVEYRRAGIAPYLMGHIELATVLSILLVTFFGSF
jgi:hypothetical protein